MALPKSISRLRGGKSLALRGEAGLVFPSGDAAGLRAARPREFGARSLPVPTSLSARRPARRPQPRRLVPPPRV